MNVDNIRTAELLVKKVFGVRSGAWESKRPRPNSDPSRALGVLALELHERGLDFEAMAKHLRGDRTAQWWEHAAERAGMLLARDPIFLRQAERFVERLDAEIGGGGPGSK